MERQKNKLKRIRNLIGIGAVLVLLAIFLQPQPSWAPIYYPPLTWEEADGSPTRINATKGIFPNGSLSLSGGEMTVSFSVADIAVTATDAFLIGNLTAVGSIADAENTANTVIAKAAHGLSIAVGDLVQVTDSSTAADKGFYRLTSLGTSVTDTSIAFTASPDEITDSNNGLGGYLVGEIVTITGTTNNNVDYTISAVAAGALTVSPTPTAEGAGASVTVASTANSIVVDRALTGTGDGDVDLTIYKDVIAIFATDGTNGQRMMNYSHQDKPMQLGGDTLVATGHGLGAEDILIAGGRLEIDADIYFDGISQYYTGADIYLNAQARLFLTSSADTGLFASESLDQSVFGLGVSTGRQLIFGDTASFTKDFDHAVQTNPTLFIHSATNPDTTNTQWISFTHDQTDGLIDVGTGTIKFNDPLTMTGDITATTAGGLDINLGTSAADDFTIDTSAFVVEGDTGNVFIGGITAGGTNFAKGIGVGIGTAPTTRPADMVQAWTSDYASGDARLYIMSENAGSTSVIIGNGIRIGTNNSDGLVFDSLGTATKAIDLSSSNLSGSGDNWIYIDANNNWRADGQINVPIVQPSTRLIVKEISNWDANTPIINAIVTNSGILFGDKTAIGSWGADGVSNGTTTITDVGGAAHGLNLAAGDLVHITAATTSGDKGFYRIVSDDGTSVVVDRALSGSDTDLAVSFYKDVIFFGATDGTNGQRMMNYSHQDKPMQLGGDVLIATGASLGSEDLLLGAKVEIVDVLTLGHDGQNISGTINFVASDNDQASLAINTSDQLVFTGASGGYSFDQDILMVTGKAIDWNSTDKLTHSANTMTVSGFTTWDMGAVATLDFDGGVALTLGTGNLTIDGGTKHDGLVITNTAEVQTTDATVTVLENFTLLDENTYHVEVFVVGIQNDGTDRASYHLACTVYRTGAGGATLQGTVTSLHTQESNANLDATFTVNSNDVRVSVTGIAAETWEWGSTVTYINMSET